jgi:hypothetical protein
VIAEGAMASLVRRASWCVLAVCLAVLPGLDAMDGDYEELELCPILGGAVADEDTARNLDPAPDAVDLPLRLALRPTPRPRASLRLLPARRLTIPLPDDPGHADPDPA